MAISVVHFKVSKNGTMPGAGLGGWPTSARVVATTTMSAALGQVGSGQRNNGLCIAGLVGGCIAYPQDSRDNRKSAPGCYHILSLQNISDVGASKRTNAT